MNKQKIKEMTREEFFILMQKYWISELGDLFAKDLELAKGDSRLAYEARGRIYDRVIGKAVETQKIEQSIEYSINLVPVDRGTVELSDDELSKIIEGEVVASVVVEPESVPLQPKSEESDT